MEAHQTHEIGYFVYYFIIIKKNNKAFPEDMKGQIQ